MKKVVVITGGTRGIGFETARTFLQNDYNVAIFGSRNETVENALKKLKTEFNSSEILGYSPNLSDTAEVENAFEQIYNKLGRIDVLINNAGVSSSTPLERYTQAEIQNILNVNMLAPFICSKAVCKYLKETKGVILNTSSVVSKYGQKSGCLYPMSKFAINGLTISLARELAQFGIRVNAVAPGITKTDMVSSLPGNVIEPLINSIPLQRVGEPLDIANAFLFLASEEADYITGTILRVDGAMLC